MSLAIYLLLLLISISNFVLRMNTGTMCIYILYARKQLPYSTRKVDAVEQRDMVNSGLRGTKEGRRPTSGRSVVPNT
jgi:hypothetical protein